jgi:hypothetical protein
VEANRQRQKQRDQKRRIQHLLDRNNVAFDLKHSAAGVWLVGPQVSDLDRNILASAQVLIFQPLSQNSAAGSLA